jgi:sulfur-oxidizing protein SoxY
MRDDDHTPRATRREVLIDAGRLAGTLGLMLTVAPTPAGATPQAMDAAMKKVVGEATLRKGRLKLDLPPLIENGNSVTMTVAADSPMTAEDHVKALHVFNEKNPQPNVISVHIGPRAGRASFTTRIRLADSQRVVAVAEMSDGSFWSEEVEVIVTLPACTESL